MAKRRKNRTHLKGDTSTTGLNDNTPKSFVLKHGHVGSSITQLVRDMRKVMEPNTATRLKERNRNKLKDYVTLAPALHVTHILAFTLTPIAPSLRIARLPDGPTLSFRVERYSLVKDVLNTTKRARSIGLEYLSAPLLVLASFPPPGPATPPHLTLLMKSFQTLFPPLTPQSLSLSAARRIVLVAYNAERGTVDLRHYIITIKPYGISRRVRKVLAAGTLDLGNEKDVADFLIRKRGESGPNGYESASSADSEAGDENSAVQLPEDYVGRNNKKGSKRAIRLDEVGPRMELKLVKITEGLPGKEAGVIYHEFVHKTKSEVAALKKAHDEKARLKKQRREEQEQNVNRKKEGSKKNDDIEAMDDGDESDGQNENEDYEDDWDDEADASEGEDSIAGTEASESEAYEPPSKKPKFTRKG